LNFGDYEYEVIPKAIGYIKDNKLYITSPGKGVLILKSNNSIGRIKIVSISKDKKQVILSIPDKIIMDKGEIKVFYGYKISSNSDKIKISKDSIIAVD